MIPFLEIREDQIATSVAINIVAATGAYTLHIDSILI